MAMGIIKSLHNILEQLTIKRAPSGYLSYSMFFPIMLIIYVITSSIMNRVDIHIIFNIYFIQ